MELKKELLEFLRANNNFGLIEGLVEGIVDTYISAYKQDDKPLNQNKMEKHVIVLWLNGNPIIDGAYYFDTREDALNHFKSLPKVEGIEITYTICRIIKHELNKSEQDEK